MGEINSQHLNSGSQSKPVASPDLKKPLRSFPCQRVTIMRSGREVPGTLPKLDAENQRLVL